MMVIRSTKKNGQSVLSFYTTFLQVLSNKINRSNLKMRVLSHPPPLSARSFSSLSIAFKVTQKIYLSFYSPQLLQQRLYIAPVKA